MSARPRSANVPPGCGGLILKWLLAALVIYLIALILPGVHVDGFIRALVAALVLGLLNTLVRPLLVIVTLPITVLTLGIFLIVINALLIMFAGWLLVGFAVDGFGWALLAAVLIGLLNLVFDAFVEGVRRSP
ncbi:MAG: phage holin family protein [Phycisphaeraceae bacterium]